MNLSTGEVVFQKDMDKRQYPASITKIMTALVVLDNCGNLQDTLTFSDYAVNSLSPNSSTLSPKASVGETMTVENALYGMMLSSANECANALAEYTAGSVEEFCNLMNAKAAEIGAVNSHFMNPHGLHHEEHYTTPHDMALIFRTAMENVSFARLVSTVNYTIPQTNLHEARACVNTHKLVNGSIECSGVYAGKTGNTVEAGRTLVTAANRYNINLVSVIMKSDNDHFYPDTQILFEYAFGKLSGSYPNVEFIPRDDTVISSVDGLRLREFPSIYATALSSVQTGNALHRVGVYAGWSAVEDSGRIVYTATDYLRTPEGETVEAPYVTLEPTTAELPEAAEKTSAAVETQAEQPALASEEETTEPEPSVRETAAKEQQGAGVTEAAHRYEFSPDMLRIAVLSLIILIAVLAGVLVAVLIIRREV